MRALLRIGVATALLLVPGPVQADPIVVTPGPVVLGLSGLGFELPRDPRSGFTWNLSSSYSIEEGSYDGRDVLDEKVDGKLVAGTWVHVGYFTAGDCKATVAEAELTESWTDERDLWGTHLVIRGGVFTFEDADLGRVPAVVYCSHRENRKDLLVYHFFIDLPPDAPRERVLAALPNQPVLERITRAWLTDAWVGSTPLRRPETRQRGAGTATRTVTLAKSGLTLTLPDDGALWIVRTPDESDVVDWLDRMAPAMNDVSLEVVRLPDTTCQEVFDGITSELRYDLPPQNLPDKWLAGPTLVVEGHIERVTCQRIGGAAVLVGMFDIPDQGPRSGDFGPLRPMLDAVAASAAGVQ